jgi:hypothetical protein
MARCAVRARVQRAQSFDPAIRGRTSQRDVPTRATLERPALPRPCSSTSEFTLSFRFARVIFAGMLWYRLSLVFVFAGCCFLQAATGKIVKVLPHYLDLQGRRALSPSLYERDAYQAHLRKTPEERSGMQFDVQWKAQKTDRSNLKLRVEIRGSKEALGKNFVLEKSIKPKRWFSTWSSLNLEGGDFQRAGDVVAWRVSLWDGDQLLAEQKSFLW